MSDNPAITSATAEALARAVEENLYALFRSFADVLGGDFDEGSRLSRYRGAPFSPMFNPIWNARLTEANADEVIRETIAWFTAREAPFFFWWLGTNTAPSDLPARLTANGLTVWDEGDPGMAVDLDDLNSNLPTPDGFAIQIVTDETGLAAFRDVFVASYGVPEWAGQAWVDATVQAGTRAPWRVYVGYLNEEPVTCTLAFNGAGVASVYGVGTIPEARGQGFGAAITAAALLDSRAVGYRYGVLFATEIGYPVYRRMGFQEVGCQIGRYLWRKDT